MAAAEKKKPGLFRAGLAFFTLPFFVSHTMNGMWRVTVKKVFPSVISIANTVPIDEISPSNAFFLSFLAFLGEISGEKCLSISNRLVVAIQNGGGAHTGGSAEQDVHQIEAYFSGQPFRIRHTH